MRPKSLMTHYAEGSIISRELEAMMHDYAADARFDAEISNAEFFGLCSKTVPTNPRRKNDEN